MSDIGQRGCDPILTIDCYTSLVERSRVRNSTRESIASQSPSGRSTRPQLVSELLTLREACKRFELYPEKIYAWSKAGALHPVQPAGRLLYPEWELRRLVSSDGVTPPYRRRFEYEEDAA